jgi:Flp pilus assembly protein TadD
MTGALWRSAFVAALFAVHPLHVESVAWIAERKDVLSAVFFMLTLAAYTRYARRRSVFRYVCLILFFACGLISKPMLVTVPFVLLLLDYWPLDRMGTQEPGIGNRLRSLLTEKVPLFALSAFSCIATLFVQRQDPIEIDQLPLVLRLQNAVVSYVTYIWQMFWPARLAVFYPHPNEHLTVLQVAGSILLLVGISLLVIWLRRSKPYLVTGWFWYLGMLVPVIGLVQVGEQAHADRYTYLPEIGLYIMIAWSVSGLLFHSTHLCRALAGVLAGVLIAALCVLSFGQTSYWKNSETLWGHTLAVTTENDVAHNNLGFLFLRRGELDKAVSEFQTALDIRSRNTQSHYRLGAALIQSNLGNALAREQQFDAAIDHLQQAVRLRPDYADAYFNLGSVLFQKGETDNAIAEWQKAIAINPRDAEAHRNIADAFQKQRKMREASSEYQRALNLAPGDSSSLNSLAWILATCSDDSIRNGARAVSLAAKAVQASGGKNPSFLRTLAAARAAAGQFAEAAATAERANELANTQNKAELARVLEEEIMLYRSGDALRQ